MKLDPRNLERLVKLLGMLGSDHDGERAAAALKANALVREHGLVWSDVIPATLQQRSSSYQQEHAKHRNNDDAGADLDWRTMRDFCAQRPGLLGPREQEFIDHIDSWCGALTEKQNAWLLAIYARVKKLAP